MNLKNGKKKSDSKGSKSRTSKAVDDHLDDEICVWQGESFTSIASSVTAPPSQRASFYKKVLGGQYDYDYGSSYDGSVDGDQVSVTDSQSRQSGDQCDSDDGGMERKKSKRDKKKTMRKGRRRSFFGGGSAAIQENVDEEGSEAPSTVRKPRRLGLFGSSVHTVDSELSKSQRSPTRALEDDDSVNISDYEDGDGARVVGGPASTNGSATADNDLGYEEAAPTVAAKNSYPPKTKPYRRTSLGKVFIKKESSHSANGSAPSKGRRSSLGFMGSSNGGKSEENGKQRVAPPRRSSMFGSMSKSNDANVKPNRRRRNSLFGSVSASEHTPRSHQQHQQQEQEQDQPDDSDESSSHNDVASATPTANTTKTAKKGLRNFLPGGASTKSVATTKYEMHWIVNHERVARGMEPFSRNYFLDKLAKSMSNELADGMSPTPSEYYGNVGRGISLEKIHATIMDDRAGISRKNILSTKFTEFGMALTQGPNGDYYMVQLFKE